MWFWGPKELEREERGEMGEGRAWLVGLMAGIGFEESVSCWLGEAPRHGLRVGIKIAVVWGCAVCRFLQGKFREQKR